MWCCSYLRRRWKRSGPSGPLERIMATRSSGFRGADRAPDFKRSRGCGLGWGIYRTLCPGGNGPGPGSHWNRVTGADDRWALAVTHDARKVYAGRTCWTRGDCQILWRRISSLENSKKAMPQHRAADGVTIHGCAEGYSRQWPVSIYSTRSAVSSPCVYYSLVKPYHL